MALDQNEYSKSLFSYQDLALKVGINNPTLITSWVSKFREQGVRIEEVYCINNAHNLH